MNTPPPTPRARRRRRLVAALAVAGLSFGLAACTGPAGRTTSTDPRLTIALISHSAPGDTFWDIVRQGAEKAAARDNVDLLYSSDPDGARQAQLIEQAVDQKVDGLVVTLAKPDAVSDAVAQATAAGIPVVSINSGEAVGAAQGVLAQFGQDERVAGQAAGDALNERKSKRAVCVIHEQGNVGHEARCAGIRDRYTGEIEILYVNGADMTNVASSITSKLQSARDIDAVVTLGAPFAVTAVDAVAAAGSSASVSTFDLNAEAATALAAGTISFIVDQQPYLQGYEGVDNLVLFHNNGNILGGGKPVLTGPQVLTKDDAAKIAEFAQKGTR